MAEKTKDEKPQNEASPPIGGGNKPFYKHVPLMAATVLAVAALLVVGYFAFRATTNDPNEENQSQQTESESLGGQLENVDFDESLSEEEIQQHELSVAAAYIAEENYEKALEHYLVAERNGITNTRMFEDMVTIYEIQNNTDKQQEYTVKLVAALEAEAASLEDPLSKAGNYVAVAQTYESLGDFEKAKSSYQQVIDVLKSYSPKDQILKDSKAETLQFAESRVSEL